MQAANARAARRQGQTTLATAVTGVGLAAAILCAGTMLAGGVREKGGELVVRQVFKSETELHGGENKLLQAKTLTLLREYAFAFADAAIRFETVPKLDTRLFYGIITAMPEDVNVEGIAFEGYDLILDCSSDGEWSRDGFVARLGENQQLTVSLESGAWPGTEEPERIRFRLRCVPREQPGELRFPAQEEEASQASILGRMW